MRKNSLVATSAAAPQPLPDPTVRRDLTAAATNLVLMEVSVWIWALVLCAAVALVSPALAVRQTSMTVPATHVKMPEHAKIALTITLAPVR